MTEETELNKTIKLGITYRVENIKDNEVGIEKLI